MWMLPLPAAIHCAVTKGQLTGGFVWMFVNCVINSTAFPLLNNYGNAIITIERLKIRPMPGAYPYWSLRVV